MFEGRKTFYEEWVEHEGLEIIRGFHIDDMMKLGLRRWDRIGAAAVHIDKCRSEFGLQGARLTLFYDPQACVYGASWEETPAGRAGHNGGFPMPAP